MKKTLIALSMVGMVSLSGCALVDNWKDDTIATLTSETIYEGETFCVYRNKFESLLVSKTTEICPLTIEVVQ